MQIDKMTQNHLSRIIALHVNDPLKMSQSLPWEFLFGRIRCNLLFASGAGEHAILQ